MNQVVRPIETKNILSDEFKANPYPTFRQWHEDGQAFRDPQQHYWISFRYDQVRDLLRNPKLTVERYDHIPLEDDREHDHFIRNLLSVWMLNVDGPAHAHARNILLPLFSNRALADYEFLIREQVERCVHALGTEGQRIDAYRQVAFPLPARIVLSIMGLEDLGEGDLERVRKFSDVISTYVGSAGRAPGCIRPTHQALVEFCDFLKEHIKPERPNFDRTLTARLLEIYGAGKDVANSPETLSNIILFIVSGFETTTNLILNTLLALGQHPSLERELRADPASLDDFIEETLRVYPPVNRTARKAVAEIELDSQKIAPGDLVILFLGAANRDPTAFPDADAFKVRRPERRAKPALSFGYGPHLCIGRLLSVMELRIFYQEVFRRYSCLDIDLDSVCRRDGSVFKGISELSFSARV